ncbi:substrate-binding domain-containing protein [Rhodococcus globerulus]|nr:substrate-binding domain-containing protein [Rhodococcus globerulus]
MILLQCRKTLQVRQHGRYPQRSRRFRRQLCPRHTCSSQQSTQCPTRRHCRTLVGAAYSTTHEAPTSENPPDAILSFILGCAPAAARAALDLGLSIPGSILIAQNSDEPALLISDPPITAVDFFPEEQAVLAVDALLALINGDEPRNQGHTRGELRVRASTDRAVGT